MRNYEKYQSLNLEKISQARSKIEACIDSSKTSPQLVSCANMINNMAVLFDPKHQEVIILAEITSLRNKVREKFYSLYSVKPKL